MPEERISEEIRSDFQLAPPGPPYPHFQGPKEGEDGAENIFYYPPGPNDFEGLILTTIELRDLPDGKSPEDLVDGDKVRFREQDGNATGTVAFLKDIKQDMNKQDRRCWREFTATYVSLEEAAKIANARLSEGVTPLFFIHGYNNQPGDIIAFDLDRIFKQERVSKYLVIPICWPTHGWYSGYNIDQDRYAMKAGKNLKSLVDDLDNDLFPRKSLMCHSMGNHVFFNALLGKDLVTNPYGPPGEAPDVRFDNIFLVAADVDYDVLLENPRDGEFGYKREKAENMRTILCPGGKIFILYNVDDLAMPTSVGFNWTQRLGYEGSVGLDGSREVRPDFQDIVVHKDIKPYTDISSKDDFKKHSYHFEQYCVDFYEKLNQDTCKP